MGRRIDAHGHVVAPGFIDLHSHGGLTILAEPRHEPKVRQGVTTEVIGVDGNCVRALPDPARPRRLPHAQRRSRRPARRRRLRLADGRRLPRPLRPRRRGQHRLRWSATRALRIAAVGWDEVEASAAQMADQRALLREGLEEGAFGLSTGLDYPPGAYASTAGAGRPPGRGGQARRVLPHPRPLPARRRVPRPVP